MIIPVDVSQQGGYLVGSNIQRDRLPCFLYGLRLLRRINRQNQGRRNRRGYRQRRVDDLKAVWRHRIFLRLPSEYFNGKLLYVYKTY